MNKLYFYCILFFLTNFLLANCTNNSSNLCKGDKDCPYRNSCLFGLCVPNEELAPSGERKVCTPGEISDCYTGSTETVNVGICKFGVRTCQSGGKWSDCLKEILPVQEICGNVLDDDCNGKIDDNCPSPSSCGDGRCGSGENCSNCSQDCRCSGGQVCQNGQCVDRGPICGDGSCGVGENCTTCPLDCQCSSGKTCQNGSCNCPSGTKLCGNFCQRCCSDSDCRSNEICTRGECIDQGAKCGNSQCESGETCATCPQDCGRCAEEGESCSSKLCSGSLLCVDWGTESACGKKCSESSECSDSCCGSLKDRTYGVCVLSRYKSKFCQTTPKCGDGKCDSSETCSSCPQDCKCGMGTFCNNGQCNSNCPNDMVLIPEIPQWCIDKYEASKGINGRATSAIGIIPWVNVTVMQARNACSLVDKILCPDDLWVRACTKGGTQKYSYGNTFNQNACYVTQNNNNNVQTTGSTTSCEGGYSGIFDMLGNVYELTNRCTSDGCRIRGVGSSPQCDAYGYEKSLRVSSPNIIGFRCCSFAPFPTKEHSIRLFNVDDEAVAYVNGKEVLRVAKNGDQSVDISNYLSIGKNTIRITVENKGGSYAKGGSYTYGVSLSWKKQQIFEDICGEVGLIGCNGFYNNDQSTGIIYDQSVIITIVQ